MGVRRAVIDLPGAIYLSGESQLYSILSQSRQRWTHSRYQSSSKTNLSSIVVAKIQYLDEYKRSLSDDIKLS